MGYIMLGPILLVLALSYSFFLALDLRHFLKQRLVNWQELLRCLLYQRYGAVKIVQNCLFGLEVAD